MFEAYLSTEPGYWDNPALPVSLQDTAWRGRTPNRRLTNNETVC